MKKGFTFIELLVVIAIVGILASIVLVSLNTVNERIRLAESLKNEQVEPLGRVTEKNCNMSGGYLTYDSRNGEADECRFELWQQDSRELN